MPRSLLLFLAALCCLLMSSCVQWRIGENIRESATWRFAVDTTHRYRCEGDKSGTLIAPEVRFHDSRRVVDLAFPEGTHYWPYGYEYTGRYRAVKVTPYEYRSDTDVGELYDVAGKTLLRVPDVKWHALYHPDTTIAPADKPQVAAVDGQEVTVPSKCVVGGELFLCPSPRGLDLKEDGVREPTIERSPWYALAAVAAAPFDYVIDPALTIVSAPLGPIYIVLFLL